MATTNIYYRGDFKTIVTLASDFILLPFKFIYTSGKLGIKQYVASYDGTKFTNCRLSDDGKKIVVVFDNHNLAPGPLKVVRVWRATDDDMPDGYFDTQFGADTGILLTTNPADCTPEAEYYERIVVESEELAQIMRGNSAYEVAVKNGYVGTEAQWVASLSAPATTAAASCNATENAVKAAEASRVTAENGRVSAEATRVSNESARQSAETNRATAEANRATAESTRTSKETARQSAETARATAESGRANAESGRVTAETARQANEEARATAESGRANAESGRVTAEASRVTAETSRASAEAARAATFNSNEATRQTTFNNSEAGRTTTFNTNEAARQSAASEQRAAESATFNSKEAQRDAAVAAATAVATDVDALERDFGQYAELPSVTLTTEQSGKYINEKGEIITATNWAIGKLGAVVVGNTYELNMGSSAKMVLGVALFVAREVTTTSSGQTKTEYIPLFSAKNTDIPSSGYVCFEAMEAYTDVLVCYRTDVSGADNILVRRYGTKASIATQINNLKKKVDLKSFADGYYQGMRVGTADNLTARGTATSEEFALRVAGGSNSIEDGDATLESIKGNSLVWNQQIKAVNKLLLSHNNAKVQMKDNGEMSIEILDAITSTKYVSLSANNVIGKCVPNHVYYCAMLGIESTKEVWLYNDSKGVTISKNVPQVVATATDTKDWYIRIGTSENAAATYALKPMVIDLTQMFGSGNEPTSVEEFRAMFTKDFYPYSEPTLLDMRAEGVKTSGKNIYNDVFYNKVAKGNAAIAALTCTYKTRLYANTKYVISANKKSALSWRVLLRFFDLNGEPILKHNMAENSFYYNASIKGDMAGGNTSNADFEFTPLTDCYVIAAYGEGNVSASTKIDYASIQIYESSTNEVVPYEEHKRSWSSTMAQYFPNGMKSAGTAYDEITSTKVVKRIGSVDLGTLTYTAKDNYFYAKYKNDVFPTQNTIMAGYTKVSQVTNVANTDKSYSCNGGAGYYIYIRNDAYTTAADFKAAMSGVILYYELATAEETEIDELNLTEHVAKGGMEEAIVAEDTESSPLKIDVVYPIDALGTILSNKAAIADLITRVTALENK